MPLFDYAIVHVKARQHYKTGRLSQDQWERIDKLCTAQMTLKATPFSS